MSGNEQQTTNTVSIHFRAAATAHAPAHLWGTLTLTLTEEHIRFPLGLLLCASSSVARCKLNTGFVLLQVYSVLMKQCGNTITSREGLKKVMEELKVG